MFESVATAPPDPILGLTEAFKQDPRPNKINLSVGVFQDASGSTPVLATVKSAEQRLLEQEKTKSYKPIPGDPAYALCVQELLFGKDSEMIGTGRAATAHTPGGTGALRVVADYLKKLAGGCTIWMSDPTWANHPPIFGSAGVPVKTYPYFDKETNGLAFDAMLTGLDKAAPGDAVLLHACCHNPTGVDLRAEQWQKLAERLAEKRLLPVIDFAYQGFASGVDEDAVGLRLLLTKLPEAVLCSSFSKNFGLYNERTGAVTFVAANKEQAQAVMSQVKVIIRSNYSNPPAHGGSIVTTVLRDADLHTQWEAEVAEMRERIAKMRLLFVGTLQALGVKRDFSFIARQNGMFSFSGLGPEHVQRLRDDHAIYIVNSGRINVAGMNESTMPALCEAIRDVLDA
jgi:aromatic-amino-acid transaminase